MPVHVKTTGCSHNCTLPSSNSSCLSSILINGTEYSHQQDGFNIAVIDDKSGRILTRHFSYLARTSNKSLVSHALAKATSFRKFFDNVKDNSTVVVVLQNVYSRFYKRWYSILQESGISLPKHLQSYCIAIIVGCKGPCINRSSIPLPFSYYGSTQSYKMSFIISVNGTGGEKSSNEGKYLESQFHYKQKT